MTVKLGILIYVLGGLFLLMILGVICGAMACPLDAVGAYLRAVVTVRVARGTKGAI